MALLRDIIFKSYPSTIQRIQQELSIINLKAVTKVTIKFDPFRNDVGYIREFSNLLHSECAIKTNPRCIIKTEILTDRSEQSITFDLKDKKKFIFKCANLKTLEIFQLYNKYITPLAPAEEVISVATGTPKGQSHGKKRRL